MRSLAVTLAVSLLACGPSGPESGSTIVTTSATDSTSSGGTTGAPSSSAAAPGHTAAPPSTTTPPASTPDPSVPTTAPPPGTTTSPPTTPPTTAPPPPTTPAPTLPPVGPDRVAVPARIAVSGCTASCLYVDAASGSDARDGTTPATAFETLNRAARAVTPGTTVLVMNGTYTTDGSENPLTLSTSGRVDAWITFAAAPGHHPVIQLPRGPNAFAGIYLPGVAYVVIDGFEVIGLNASITPQEAAMNDGTQAVLNQNCVYIDGMGFGSFHPAVPHDIVIRNSTLHGCSAAGIEANVADALTIAYNRVYDTSWWTVFGTSGMGFLHLTDAPGSGTTGGYKNFVVGNLVYGNRNELPWKTGNPPAIYDGNGIIVDDANHAQPAVGIHDVQGVPYTGRTYIANNVVHTNGGRGIHVYSSSHVDVVNNTTYDDLRSTSGWIGHGEIDAEASTAVNILNDVAVNLVGKEANMNDGNRYDYDVWDAARVAVQGPHDVIGPAGLGDPAHGDFVPRPGSPAIASGTTELAPTLDFFGNPRPSSPIDRGAIQVSR